ncbi:MAG: DHH family phosphoesterase [Firmicutes bacterium]|nr:DHH family phosphoesterase [Bacillota bacterium]
MSKYRQMADFLLNCENLLLTAHHDPDADCIGSMLGLYHVAQGAKHGWTMVLEDKIPANLQYLPGSENIICPADIVAQPQHVLFLDCGEVSRVSRGWLNAYLNLPFYCIDHHVSNSFSGVLSLLEQNASSTGEIVAAMCDAAEIALNIEAATSLYTAIVSDTGCFRYENTTPRALEIAAKLLRQGVDMEKARVQLFESRSAAGMVMLQIAFRNMCFTAQDRICYSFVSYADAKAVQATASDLNNIANYTLLRAGVKIGVLFEEYEHSVAVSLRSRQGLRMDKLAQSLGGGGHIRAAGCLIEGNLDAVLPQVLDKALAMILEEQ